MSVNKPNSKRDLITLFAKKSMDFGAASVNSSANLSGLNKSGNHNQ